MSNYFDYSSMQNFEQLLDVSQACTQVYQFLQATSHVEPWEIELMDELILSEKVFNI